MFTREFEIIIKENDKCEDGSVRSTVGLRFEKENCFVGDYEKFDSQELTDEQITGAVQRLVEKFVPEIPKEETKPFGHYEKGIVFKRTPDGKFVPA